MAAKVPSGPIGQAFADARLALAQCVSFQQWAGVADATAALAFIHYWKTESPVSKSENPELAATLEIYQPGYWFKNVGSRGAPVYEYGGSLVISFQAITSEEWADDPGSAFAEHMSNAGPVMVEMRQTMYDQGRPISQALEFQPARPGEKKDTGRPYQQSWWRVDWGCDRVNVT